MSKTLNAMEQVKEIKRNKLTEALEKGKAAGGPSPVEAPKEIVRERARPEEPHPVSPKHSPVGIPILMAVVILLGVVFITINYRVLAELHSVRNSMALLMRNTGVQKGKVSTIESTIVQVSTENKKLRNDLQRHEKVMVTLIEKVQSDVADTEIASGILRSKLSELNSTQKKLVDQYIELGDDVRTIKKMHADPVQQSH